MAIIKKFRIKSFKQKKPILKLENVSLTFGNRQILENINFEINKGEIFGMLGPNGVGKSTIFNLVTGLISPEKGSIFIIDPFFLYSQNLNFDKNVFNCYFFIRNCLNYFIILIFFIFYNKKSKKNTLNQNQSLNLPTKTLYLIRRQLLVY